MSVVHAAQIDVKLSIDKTNYDNDIIKFKTILSTTYNKNINIRVRDTPVYIVDNLGKNMTFYKYAFLKEGISERINRYKIRRTF